MFIFLTYDAARAGARPYRLYARTTGLHMPALRQPSHAERCYPRCVFNTMASRAAPVREAVISVLARSRSRTR